MNKIDQLLSDVAVVRNEYLFLLKDVDEAQAAFKPAKECWNLVDITEHLFWAEQGGIYGMWKTLYAIRQGTAERSLESVHKNLSIHEIIERTWNLKEKVPAIAAPRLGGTLAFWCSSLASLQLVLEAFGRDLKEEELRLQAHPHPISGAMDFHQRFEFIAFHIRRHHLQAETSIQTFISK